MSGNYHLYEYEVSGTFTIGCMRLKICEGGATGYLNTVVPNEHTEKILMNHTPCPIVTTHKPGEACVMDVAGSHHLVNLTA